MMKLNYLRRIYVFNQIKSENVFFFTHDKFFINYTFQKNEAKSEAVKRSVIGIGKAFKQFPVLALPNPGKGIRNKGYTDRVTLKCK